MVVRGTQSLLFRVVRGTQSFLFMAVRGTQSVLFSPVRNHLLPWLLTGLLSLALMSDGSLTQTEKTDCVPLTAIKRSDCVPLTTRKRYDCVPLTIVKRYDCVPPYNHKEEEGVQKISLLRIKGLISLAKTHIYKKNWFRTNLPL